MSATSGCQDTRIKKIEFVARTHLLLHECIEYRKCVENRSLLAYCNCSCKKVLTIH